MSKLYIGLMSGTSLDGIDIALCKIDSNSCILVNYREYPFNSTLKDEILKIISSQTTLKEIGLLHKKLGTLYANAIKKFLKEQEISAHTIEAIGLHGQTLWHEPNGEFPFSMQLGCPNSVVAQTGIKVISDFRNMDIANGGEGAPLTPAFHKFVFNSNREKTAVLNIGGMANITLIQENLLGWDTGCGNVLLDLWIKSTQNRPYDKDGNYAKSGTLNRPLLNAMLEDKYFKKLPPKSTGREYFNQEWLKKALCSFLPIKDEDVQRTLLELTAFSVAKDVIENNIALLIVCGGGVKNSFLMQRIQELSQIKVQRSDDFGLNSDALEAMAFAWFAYKRVHRQSVKIKTVTGAKKNSILGGIYE